MSRFRFVDDHRDTYEVKRLCELVECSRSGYYAWRDPAAVALGRSPMPSCSSEIRRIHTRVAAHLRRAPGPRSATPAGSPGRLQAGRPADAPATACMGAHMPQVAPPPA